MKIYLSSLFQGHYFKAVFQGAVIVAIAIFIARPATSQTIIRHEDGSATYRWERNERFVGETFLLTSNPGKFTGVNVAQLLGAKHFYDNGKHPNTTFVASVGNGYPLFKNVGSPAAGYNGISVGALQNIDNKYETLADFTAGTLQAYGDPVNGALSGNTARRAAVDIVAPGTHLTSAFYGGQSGENDASLPNSFASGNPYHYTGDLKGTSFSAPIVAGSVALMCSASREFGMSDVSRDSRVIKANLLNAATKTDGWDNGQTAHLNGHGGVITHQALDFRAGAGALDLARTWNQYMEGEQDLPGLLGGYTVHAKGWDFGNVLYQSANDILIGTPLLGGTELNVTLSWFRQREYLGPGEFIDKGFADLNLEVWDVSFSKLVSESRSLYTPVEHLSFVLPETMNYAIRVRYKGNIFGDIRNEDYAVAWYGVSTVPEPSAMCLVSIALIGIGCHRRKRTVN
jgi:hypothetical protein